MSSELFISTCLFFYSQFNFKVSEHEKQNRMSVASLASMFAPNFLRQQDEDPYIEMSASQLINHTVTEFIKAYQVLFPHELKSPNWDKLNINNHNIHVLHNHKDLNTLPVDFKRIQTQMNSSVSRCKTTNDRDTLMGRSQDSFTESVIYESPKNSPYHSSVNSSNNNNNINHYHHHENGRNHRATTTTTVTTTIFNNNNNKQHNNVITNPIDHIHQYNYNSILLNNAKSSHDYHTNNIYMRSRKFCLSFLAILIIFILTLIDDCCSLICLSVLFIRNIQSLLIIVAIIIY